MRVLLFLTDPFEKSLRIGGIQWTSACPVSHIREHACLLENQRPNLVCRHRHLAFLRLAPAPLPPPGGPFLAPPTLLAGGPKYIAGSAYFNPAMMGQPVHWAGGQVGYYVDQGPLNASVSNQQATAMVDAAAALWSAVPTAGVTLADMGPLNEDVSGRNIQVNSAGQITAPADVTPSATNYPVAVIYDADGSVINAISAPTPANPLPARPTASTSGSTTFSPDATFAHGVILLNGRCATKAESPRDDEFPTRVRLRPRPRSRLLAGQPWRRHQRRRERHSWFACHAAFHRRSAMRSRRRMHS